jgi:hypothetical protein
MKEGCDVGGIQVRNQQLYLIMEEYRILLAICHSAADRWEYYVIKLLPFRIFSEFMKPVVQTLTV